MKNLKTILTQSIFCLIPIVYYLSIWNNLPNSVPTHYNIHNVADDFGTKLEMLMLIILMPGIALVTSLLILNIDKFDPKKQMKSNAKLLIKISWSIIIFMTLISCYIVYTTENYTNSTYKEFSSKYIIALVALLFTVIGNYMNNLKPNYFVGIRTPWTLSNDENWKRTHYLASKLWFFGGLVLFILSLVLPNPYSSNLIGLGVIPLGGIPIIYSFYLFKKNRNKI